MTAPWKRTRRSRYAPRSHEMTTKPGGSWATATVVPDEISWKVRPGDATAHAYSTGPGWMRSRCGAERWSVLWDDAPADLERCDDCALLVDGAPGEITEAWGR